MKQNYQMLKYSEITSKLILNYFYNFLIKINKNFQKNKKNGSKM